MPLQYTGYIERQERDSNPNSPTYGDTRWVTELLPSATCPSGPEIVTYYSAEIVEVVDIPGCAEPKGIPYTLPAGAKTSTYSQLEADRLAQDYFDLTKTEYAQTNGEC